MKVAKTTNNNTWKHPQAGRSNFEVGMERGSANYTERMGLPFICFDLLLPLISVKLPLQPISTQNYQDTIYDFFDRDEVNLNTVVGNAA